MKHGKWTAIAAVMLALAACRESVVEVTPVVPTGPEFGSIRGYIADDLGVPLNGVAVTLSRWGQERQTTSGVGGHFTFTNVEIGSWILSYEVAGFLLVEGVNPRTVAIKANHETVVPPLLLGVIPVASIKIAAVPAALLPGNLVQLTARAVGANGGELPGRNITFSGGNNTVASVSATGLLTAIGPGKVAVTASAEGKTGTREMTVNYPVPTVSSIMPTSVPTVEAAVISLRGTNFYPATVVRLGGVAKPTTLISNIELRVNLTAADVATFRTAAITVFNPSPGGGTSGLLWLSVKRPSQLCSFLTPLTLGIPVSAALDTNDCNTGTASAPLYQDDYKFTTTAPTAVTFTLTSSAFDPFLLFGTDPTNSVALHAFELPKNPAIIRLLLPARTFAVSSGTVRSGAVGAYTLSSTTSTALTVTNCETWHVVPPMILAGTVTTSACAYFGTYWDDYAILIRAGQTVKFTLESTAFNGYLYMIGDEVELYDDNSGDGNTQIVFTPKAAGIFVISAGPVNPNVTGAYTLRIN